jgi:hypothetical protein
MRIRVKISAEENGKRNGNGGRQDACHTMGCMPGTDVIVSQASYLRCRCLQEVNTRANRPKLMTLGSV